jgi:hypothetical protein
VTLPNRGQMTALERAVWAAQYVLSLRCSGLERHAAATADDTVLGLRRHVLPIDEWGCLPNGTDDKE